MPREKAADRSPEGKKRLTSRVQTPSPADHSTREPSDQNLPPGNVRDAHSQAPAHRLNQTVRGRGPSDVGVGTTPWRF
ncbi:unnamed protein product [Gulo gulo]|uniref:Uncharacterized protein n=1 Tax=Gulo gulo TaxID=48420 RepID=A0A9X9LZK6_GULGU|nr:unnamed protein product [Gulo gulo]